MKKLVLFLVVVLSLGLGSIVHASELSSIGASAEAKFLNRYYEKFSKRLNLPESGPKKDDALAHRIYGRKLRRQK